MNKENFLQSFGFFPPFFFLSKFDYSLNIKGTIIYISSCNLCGLPVHFVLNLDIYFWMQTADVGLHSSTQ